VLYPSSSNRDVLKLTKRQFTTAVSVGFVLFLAFASTVVRASDTPSSQDLPDRISALQALKQQIEQAQETVAEKDWAAALPMMTSVVDSPSFEYLPVDVRQKLLTSAGGVALHEGENKLAQTYSTRACLLPNVLAINWQIRFYASFGLEDMNDASLALIQVAKAAPKNLADIKDEAIFRILSDLKNSSTSAAQYFDLMAALYSANWKVGGVSEPSATWRDYAVVLLERGRTAETEQVIRRIKHPSALISLRVDKRFDFIQKISPALFNISNAVDAEITDLREIAGRTPRSLQNLVDLTYALLKARRYDEVLTITDDVIQKEAARGRGKSPYDDDSDNLIWILNNRAIALGGLGRREEELELLVRAARRPEHGAPNVSQAINLGEFYCDLGRPKDALFAILDAQDVSPYGQMQVGTVRLCAGLQQNDQAAANAALKYMKEHQADSPKTYQTALIEAGDNDAAAAILIERLKSPRLRSDVLTEIQDYRDPQDLTWPVKSNTRFKTILARDDVRKTLDKVGRIESFDLRSDLD
jgi:beta-barrel assembly-enhancing protease